MKLITILCFLFVSFSVLAKGPCNINEYLKSYEASERLKGLIERSKGLFLSKLEDLGVKEDQVEIRATLPKSLDDSLSILDIKIKSTSLKAEGAKLTLSRVLGEDGCGLEVSIQGGSLLSVDNTNNFGGLGRLKEFIRLN